MSRRVLGSNVLGWACGCASTRPHPVCALSNVAVTNGTAGVALPMRCFGYDSLATTCYVSSAGEEAKSDRASMPSGNVLCTVL